MSLDYFYFIVQTPATRQHSGWQSIRFKGQRFQLYGGIRGPFFINLDRPIVGR